MIAGLFKTIEFTLESDIGLAISSTLFLFVVPQTVINMVEMFQYVLVQ